eukprot:403357976
MQQLIQSDLMGSGTLNYHNHSKMRYSYIDSKGKIMFNDPFKHHTSSIFERLCLCCFNNNQLTNKEIERYVKFQHKMIHSYNQLDKDHEKYLADLYLLIFGDEKEGLPKRLETKKWREIGFQTKNPRNDFKNGGILALHSLRYFVKKYPDIFQEMLREGREASKEAGQFPAFGLIMDETKIFVSKVLQFQCIDVVDMRIRGMMKDFLADVRNTESFMIPRNETQMDQQSQQQSTFDWSDDDINANENDLLIERQSNDNFDNQSGTQMQQLIQSDLMGSGTLNYHNHSKMRYSYIDSKGKIMFNDPFKHHTSSIFERLCLCCFNNNQLTNKEIERYVKFQHKMIHSYNQLDKDHEKYLADLYLLIFGDEKEGLPKRLETKKWREIGFQTKNPRNDFKNGGILALHSLRYFVKKYPDIFQEMLREGREASKEAGQFPAFGLIMDETKIFVSKVLQFQCIDVVDMRIRGQDLMEYYINHQRFL